MEVKKGAWNSVASVFNVVIVGILQFVKLSLLIRILGTDASGINSLFTQLTSFLLITEAGLSLATVTTLYKYVAQKDFVEINRVVSGSMLLFRKIIYLIFLFSIPMVMVMPFLIKDNQFSILYLCIAFVLFLIKAISPYIFQPVKGYVSASNNEHILKMYSVVTMTIVTIVEIASLYLFRNYIITLFLGAFLALVSEGIIYLLLKKKFKEIRLNFTHPNFEAKKHIGELLKSSIVSTVAKALDPIIISTFMGLFYTTVYSSYYYIVNFCIVILNSATGGFAHFLGAKFTRKDENIHDVFCQFTIITNYVVTLSCLIFLFNCQHFIAVWIGAEFQVDTVTLICFSFILYMFTIMKPINILVTSNQYFNLISVSAIIETTINITLSLILIHTLGIKGILIATMVAFAMASFWYFPVKSYKKTFGLSSTIYFKTQFISIFILFLFSLIIAFIQNQLYGWMPITLFGLLGSLALSGSVLFLFITGIYFILFKEFRVFFHQVQKRLRRV